MSNSLALIILLSLVTISVAINFYKKYLNYKRLDDVKLVKEVQKELELTDEQVSESLVYMKACKKRSATTLWNSYTFSTLMLLTGFLGIVEKFIKQFTGSYGDMVTGSAMFLFMAFSGMLFNISYHPIADSAYTTFDLEQRFGFNRTTVGLYIKDTLKSICLTPLGLIAVIPSIYIISKFQNWWVYLWGMGFVVETFFGIIFPVISRFFNTYKPLEEGTLKNRIEELAKKANYKAGKILVEDTSIRTSHPNAYCFSFLWIKEIVLTDNLVNEFTEDEIVSVFAHELGHYAYKHSYIDMVVSTIFSALGYYLTFVLFSKAWVYSPFGLEPMTSYGILLIASNWIGFVTAPIGYFMSWVSRKCEYQADLYEVKAMGRVDYMVTAMKKMYTISKSLPLTHPISKLESSHPDLIERINAVNGYAKKMGWETRK